VFSFQSEGWIKLVDLKTNTTTNLVYQKDVKDVRMTSYCSLALGLICIYRNMVDNSIGITGSCRQI
jgi:hypothetical protein